MKFLKKNEGQVSIGAVIGTVILTIVIIAVAIPVTDDVITDQNLTGTTATVVELLPLFFALAGLLAVAGLFLLR